MNTSTTSFFELNFNEIESQLFRLEAMSSNKRKLNQNEKFDNKRSCVMREITNASTASIKQKRSRLEKRNERERKRVQCVNNEFERLRNIIINSDYYSQKSKPTSFNFSQLPSSFLMQSISDCSISSEIASIGEDKENNLLYGFSDENSYEDDNFGTNNNSNSMKRLSKLRTLKTAIEYIQYLSDLLGDTEQTQDFINENSELADNDQLSESENNIFVENLDLDLIDTDDIMAFNNSFNCNQIQIKNEELEMLDFDLSFRNQYLVESFDDNTDLLSDKCNVSDITSSFELVCSNSQQIPTSLLSDLDLCFF